jgi:hypothetical protein
MTGESSGNDHTLLARVDENVKMVLARFDDICGKQDEQEVRIRKLEIAQAETNIRIGIGATIAGIASAIIGVFVQRP